MSTEIKTSTTTTIGQFGNGGKFSDFMDSMFKQTQSLFGLSPAVADKIARNAASDLGKAMKNGQCKFKLGGNMESGKVSIKAAYETLKAVAVTRNLKVMYAVQYAGDAVKNGVNYQETGWQLIPELVEYVKELQEELDAEAKAAELKA